MKAITITLPDDELAKLQDMAKRTGVSPEELARVGIEELLGKPTEEYQEAAE